LQRLSKRIDIFIVSNLVEEDIPCFNCLQK
jgi:hypothetical protein